MNIIYLLLQGCSLKNSSILLDTVIAEFERLLGVTYLNTEEIFMKNFKQVSKALLGKAAKVRGRETFLDVLLNLLDKVIKTDSTEGKLSGMKL